MAFSYSIIFLQYLTIEESLLLPEQGKKLLIEGPERTIVTFNGPPKLRKLPNLHMFLLVGCILKDGKIEAIITGEEWRTHGGMFRRATIAKRNE